MNIKDFKLNYFMFTCYPWTRAFDA